MSKLHVIKEFDSITFNEQYKDEYEYLPREPFEDLENFVLSYESDDDIAEAQDFLKIGSRKNVGKIISAKNYVGLIQMKNGHQIEILPKISFDEGADDNNKETKRVFIRMLRSMDDFPCKVFNDASLKMDRMNLYEVFINMYLQEVRQLVKHGLKSAYVTLEDNLGFYKGKLLVGEHIRKNIIHKEKFYVAYDEYHVNRAENRLVKATLLKLQNLSCSSENQKTIRQLLIPFEMVDKSQNYEKDFSKVVVDRNTKDYDVLMRWSKVFLQNKSFTPFSGDANARALLFPMEKVFESYVAKELRKTVHYEGWSVTVQAKGNGRFLFEEPNKRFTLKPDIILTRDDGRLVIMDTKWKRLIDDPSKNYGISQADMYQMYAYSKKYGSPEIWLLYPKNDKMDNTKNIYYSSNDYTDNTNVKLFFVDVANISDSLNELIERLKDQTNTKCTG